MSRRIKYYGENDLSIGYEMTSAIEVLSNLNQCSKNYNIDDIHELYNIKCLFDIGVYPANWSCEQYTTYQDQCKPIPQILGKYFSAICEANILQLYGELDQYYHDDFWKLFSRYKLHERISDNTLEQLILTYPDAVWHMIHNKPLVQHYGALISAALTSSLRSAEWLMMHFLSSDTHYKSLYFPDELTQELRTELLTRYIDSSTPNPNFLQLLFQAQSTKEFPISDRIKLKAKRKHDAFQEEYFAEHTGIPFGAEVIFKSIPDGSVEETSNDNIVSYAYSREWIEENLDYPTLLNNFLFLFRYVDKCGRCNFLSLKSELGVFERTLGIKGLKEYQTGIQYNVKALLSDIQIHSYRQFLHELGIEIEDLFKWFFEVYLPEEFNAHGFTYTPPSPGTTPAEKCKLLSISIDGILKQYRLFCEDGSIDRELLEISSSHVVFSELPSFMQCKYVYPKSNEIIIEQNLLYSDQSMMNYTEKTRSEYKTLPQLLLNETITADDYREYQKKDMDWLIGRGTVNISETGQLLINTSRAFILKDLFENEVLCPAYHGSHTKGLISQLIQTGDLISESTLFSRPEQDYLNYILNKAQFSNGLDLRNKYAHDSCSLDEKIQLQDYNKLLKIMVFIIIKINEEFCMRRL